MFKIYEVERNNGKVAYLVFGKDPDTGLYHPLRLREEDILSGGVSAFHTSDEAEIYLANHYPDRLNFVTLGQIRGLKRVTFVKFVE